MTSAESNALDVYIYFTVLYSITQMLLEVIVNTPVQGSGGGQEGSPGRDRVGQRRPFSILPPVPSMTL